MDDMLPILSRCKLPICSNGHARHATARCCSVRPDMRLSDQSKGTGDGFTSQCLSCRVSGGTRSFAFISLDYHPRCHPTHRDNCYRTRLGICLRIILYRETTNRGSESAFILRVIPSSSSTLEIIHRKDEKKKGRNYTAGCVVAGAAAGAGTVAWTGAAGASLAVA